MLLIVLDLVGSAAATVFPLLANAHAISKPSVRRLALSCQSAVRSRQAFGRIVKAPSSGLRVSATETCAAGAQAPVLLVADLLHPVDRLAVEPLLDGDVAHRRGRRRAGRGFRSVISVTPSYGELCFNLTMRWTAGRTAAGLEMRRCCEIYEATACTMSA